MADKTRGMSQRKRTDIRFAVVSPEGPRSSVWAVWAKNGQVYACHRSMGGVQKIAFHTPLVCRHALTRERANLSARDRVAHEWLRAETPPTGSGRASLALRLIIPTDYLSTQMRLERTEEVVWIPAAPSGECTVVELFFTRDDQAVFQAGAAAAARRVLAYARILEEEALAIASHIAGCEFNGLRIPASHHEKRDLVIAATDPDDTGRPVRLTTFNHPKNGEALELWEFGGFWVDPT